MLLLLLYYGGLLLLSCRRTAEVSKETAATSNESRAVPKHSGVGADGLRSSFPLKRRMGQNL